MRHFWKGFTTGFQTFGKSIAAVVNTLLLFVVYVMGVGLTSIIAKITRKHFLETTISEDHDTYWSPFGAGARDRNDYYKQF